MIRPEKKTQYATQARGDYDRYYAGMEKTARQKLAVTAAHFLLRPGAVIADMGCGSGLGSFIYAQENPDAQVVGIDINPASVAHARETYSLPNLRFEEGDVENPDAALGPFDGILNSSVLHHVYSFNGYDAARVVNALKSHMELLREGGVMVVRDFCALPADDFVLLDVQAEGGEGYTPKTMSDADLLVLFSETACALKGERDRGFFIEEQPVAPPGFRRFRLPAKWAAEFVLRKDYRDDWETELQEEYSWWTAEDYRRELAALGGRVVYAAPWWNPWIVENRFRGKFRMYGENGAPRNFPPTNFIAVVEKTRKGASAHLCERAVAKGEKSYLRFTGWKNTVTGEGWDMAARPGDVTDCLPYVPGEGGRLMIYAKHGYPRPLANPVPRGTPVLDEKHWSGHMVEPVAVADAGENLAARLAERSGLAPAQFAELEEGLTYYPSPGMMDELVTSVFTRVSAEDVNHRFPIPPAVSGFSDSGDVRLYAAQDLLGAGQAGLLPEARLELNIYALLKKLGLSPGRWIGAEIARPRPSDPDVAELAALLSHPREKIFAPTAATGDYLQCLRSVFADRSAETELAAQELEFVLPASLSANVVSVAALATSAAGEICIGVERRDLPAPQGKEGGSSICVLPAFRLPMPVATAEKSAEYVAARFLQQRRCVSRLGEGYFSSIGVTPERVYPHAVMLEPGTDVFQLSEELQFVPLREVFTSLEKLRDAHLLIAALRAIHALGLWDGFMRG